MDVSYTVDARISSDLTGLQGKIRITIDADQPLNEVQLLLFPYQLNLGPKDLDDIEFPRVYPGRLSLAEMQVTWSLAGRVLDATFPQPPPGWRPKTLMSVVLPEPAAPGARLVLEGDFQVTIPRRFGLFGLSSGQLTLDGGWFPTLVGHDGLRWRPESIPPRAPMVLTLRYPATLDALVDGIRLEPDVPPPAQGVSDDSTREKRSGRREQVSTISMEAQFPALALGELDRHMLDAPVPATLYDRRDRAHERETLERLLRQGLAIWEAVGLPRPASSPPIVRAPLRRKLVALGEGTIWMSDRALRVDPLLRRYHEFSVLHALYQAWLEDLLTKREPLEDLRWVSDGLAWTLVDLYRGSIVAGSLQVTDVVGKLSFIPEFDAMLNAPTFAFSKEIYEREYGTDPYSDAVLDLLQPMPSGRILFMKLEDRFGRVHVNDAALSFLRGGEDSFERLLAREAGVPLERVLETVASWKRPYPYVNYKLFDIERQHSAEGYDTAFSVTEEPLGLASPDEPVTLEMKTTEGTQRGVWDGQGEEHFTFRTDDPVKRITIDPDQRLLETNTAGVALKGDNSWPKKHKFMFAFAPAALDLSTLRFQGSVVGYLTTPYERNWLWWSNAYTTAQVLFGGSLGLVRYFGRYRNQQWRVNQAGLTAVVNHRAVSDSSSPSGSDSSSPSGESSTLEMAGLRGSFFHESRVSYRHPLQGISLYAGLEGGWAGAPSSGSLYGMCSLSGVKPFSFHPRHALVARARTDAAIGLNEDGGSSFALFSLGGYSALRGLASNEVMGNRRWLVSLEYRAMLFRDPDIYALGVHLADVQLVLFADAGAAGNDWDDLFRPMAGAGAGIRFFLEIMAIGQSMVGIDIAGRVDDPTSPEAFLRFGQPF